MKFIKTFFEKSKPPVFTCVGCILWNIDENIIRCIVIFLMPIIENVEEKKMRKKTPKTCDEGFYVCKYCSGFGYVISNQTYNVTSKKKPCLVCDGEGQVDWIEHSTNRIYDMVSEARKTEVNSLKAFHDLGTVQPMTSLGIEPIYKIAYNYIEKLMRVKNI